MTMHDEPPSGASIPIAALATLADLRCAASLVVIVDGDLAWLRWEPDDSRTLQRIMAVPGAALYHQRGASWCRRGSRLPAPDVPLDSPNAMPIHRAIWPQPVVPVSPSSELPTPARLTLTRDDRPRAASALKCALADLSRWAELATSAQLARVRAARAGDDVLLLARRLPAIAAGERFCGERVLVPLGFRPDPQLSEDTLRAALRVGDGELLVLENEGPEIVPYGAFGPLTRSAVRLAAGEGAP